MAKIKWGGQALADAIDEHEEDSRYAPYDGPKPAKGVYQWKLLRLEKLTSSGGFPQMCAHLELVPRTGRKDEAKYGGYYMRDYIIVKEDGSTAFRIKPLLEALGVTAKQFVTLTMTKATDDPEVEEIIKIGPVKIPDNLLVGNIWPQKGDRSEYFNIKYLPKGDGSDGSDTAAPGKAEGDDSDPPF